MVDRCTGTFLWLIFTAVISMNTYLFILYIPRFHTTYSVALGFGLSLIIGWFVLEIGLATYLIFPQRTTPSGGW